MKLAYYLHLKHVKHDLNLNRTPNIIPSWKWTWKHENGQKWTFKLQSGHEWTCKHENGQKWDSR